MNVTPRQLRSFRRKRDDDSFLVSQKPGLNDGELQLPVGLVQGQVIDMIMSRVVFAVASQVEDFDELAIPFRAVAGDLVTGEAVILESGDLARAIRASMVVPAALSPMEIDGRLLVDGGIVMNLPVDVARDGRRRHHRRRHFHGLARVATRSAPSLDVTTQLTNLLTRGGTVEGKRSFDGQRRFDIAGVPANMGSAGFTASTRRSSSGYAAVMEQRDDSPPRYGEERRRIRAERTDPRVNAPPIVDFVRLDNDSPSRTASSRRASAIS